MSSPSERRRATRFFWGWLIASTTASVLGNVTHALFNTAAGNTGVAAIAAIVPPSVLLAATHGLSMMVRTQITGKLYRSALGLLVALAVCAFALSFDALNELAIHQGGMPATIAWLWPLAIDCSVAFPTIALLSLTTGKRAQREAAAANRKPRRRRAPAKAVKAVREVAA